jgi:hypothetical protein
LLEFAVREDFKKAGCFTMRAKIVQIERNTKGKRVFLWIFEMQPSFDEVKDSANHAKYQIF